MITRARLSRRAKIEASRLLTNEWLRRLYQILRGITLPLRLLGAVSVVAIMRTPKSIRKYALGWVCTTTVVWVMIGAYLSVAKPTYTSRWTLILPTASSGLSLQLESIGHAQTVSSSPFGSSSLSPKVIYKEIISSERVLMAAANSLGMKLSEFGTVRVKLIDETALMLLEIVGPSAQFAQRKANAVMDAFHQQLDSLRNDEIQRRAEVVSLSLKSYRVTVEGVRDKISAHQQATGLLSINQYNEASTTLELMKRKLADVRADESRLAAEQASLVEKLGMSPRAAADMLKLSSDPAFNKAAGDYADSVSNLRMNSAFMHDANPVLKLSQERAGRAERELHELASTAGVAADFAIKAAAITMNGTHRSDLVKALVTNEASLFGKREELRTLEDNLERAISHMKLMNAAATRLEDLKKDHLLAEAVFTSALARVDTNKIDIYSSYPMVQTLAPPDLQEKRTSPSTMVCLIVGIAGTLLSLAGWSMAWLRFIFLQKR